MSAIKTEFISMPHEAFSPGLRYMEGGGAGAAPSLFAKAKSLFSEVWGWLVQVPGRVWGWAKETLHLQPVVDKTKAGWAWVKHASTTFLRAMGPIGMTGIGLLVISTEGGRSAAHTALAPVRWVGSLLGKGWTATSSFFTDHLGGFGDWMAARMGDVEEFLFGTTTLNTKPFRLGVLTRIKAFWGKHIAKHTKLNSFFMLAARVAGIALFGYKLIGLLPLLGLTGAFLTVATYLGWALLVITVVAGVFFLCERVVSVPKVQAWLNETKEEARARRQPKPSDLSRAAANAATDGNRPRAAHNAGLREEMRAATAAVDEDRRRGPR